MMTIEDLKRMAAQAGERDLVAAISRVVTPRTPSDLKREVEAAGRSTANQSEERR